MSKFKNTEELEKAYKELEREFTKKSQKLVEVEKTNYVTLLHNEMDSLLNDYAKRKISDLEAKLAESEETIKYLKGIKRYDIGEMLTENTQLKQQLAEKEKEIEIYKEEHCFVNDLYNAFEELTIQGLKNTISETVYQRNALLDIVQNFQKTNQDKISFCIEKLEHLRNVIDNETYYCYGDNNINIVINKNKFNELIDNQIEQLKKEMKEICQK